jgi:tRNA(Ile)-lysidine synthase
MNPSRVRPLHLLHRVRTVLRRHDMLSGGATVVVAVSGGPDSMALLHMLLRLKDEFRLRLRVAHVDHSLHRSSAAHAAFVRRMAAAWGVPVSVRTVDVAAYRRRHRMTVEEAARALRYRALAQVARRARASHIATAHTADDQAETVLLWLLRGAGSDGLAGMPPARPLDGLRVIRPLIEVWRREVLDYLAAERVLYRTDPTNRLRRPLRNRIRQDLLPRLAGYNPGVKAVLLRLAAQVADDAALLGHLAGHAGMTALRRQEGLVVIDARRFAALPPSLQRRIAHRALTEAGGNIRGLAFVHIERLRDLAGRGRPGERADLPGARAERTEHEIVLTRAPTRGRRRMLDVRIETRGRSRSRAEGRLDS